MAPTSQFQIWRFFAHNSLRNYTYVLVKSATQEALAIDPWDGDEILTWARGKQCDLVGVLNTHGHADHIRGNDVLLAHGVPLLHQHPWLETIAAPGHTLDHVTFLLTDGPEQHFFAGDTLFQSGVGNCKGGGDTGLLFQTVQHFHRRFAPHTVIHPGHDYLGRNLAFAAHVEPPNAAVASALAQIAHQETHDLAPSTWGLELTRNPFLRLGSPELRQRLYELDPGLPAVGASDEMVFKQLRKFRDTW